LELRHIRYFVALAEELHFGRAAKRLHVAQPSLSRQIRDLEEELGVRLLDRNRRGATLTAAGATLLEESRRLLLQFDSALEATRHVAAGRRGTLRIAYVSTVAYSGLPEIVRNLRRRVPDVQVHLEEMPPADQVEALLADEVDVGFMRGPVYETTLEVWPVLEEALLAALPAGHSLATHKSLAVSMLAGEPFVLQARARGPGMHDHVLAICRDAGFSPRVVQEGSQLDVLSLVAAGVGVAIVPASLSEVRRLDVTYHPLRERPRTQLVMAWRKDSRSRVLHEFVADVRRRGDHGIFSKATGHRDASSKPSA
jgi:DNA-binding transcriptional LysR family regulator